jgi:peptidoglycan hydrolase-like protein with peptidoglycan-binding domain
MALTSLRFSRDPQLQKASDNNPPLKRGATGQAVITVQLALLDLGFDLPITTGHGSKLPDGIFGQETDRVVRQFQQTFGLAVDGEVGRQTLQKLEQLTNADIAAEKAKLAAAQRVPPGQAPSDHRTLRR